MILFKNSLQLVLMVVMAMMVVNTRASITTTLYNIRANNNNSLQQLLTASADGGDGDDGGEHKSLPVRPDRPCHRESCAAGEQKLYKKLYKLYKLHQLYKIYNLTKICKTKKYRSKNYATGKQFCLVHYTKYTTLQKKMHNRDFFVLFFHDT